MLRPLVEIFAQPYQRKKEERQETEREALHFDIPPLHNSGIVYTSELTGNTISDSPVFR